MADGMILTSNSPTFSGLIFNKGNNSTPLLSMISGRTRKTTSNRFVVGQSYNSDELGFDIPNISEIDSLTAPAPKYVTREQFDNVTQIFQETVAISYDRMSDISTLSGLNIAGQQANPQNELAEQIAIRLANIQNKIENTFINGTYQIGTGDRANRTRGLKQAITTNVLDIADTPLTFWVVAQEAEQIYNSNAPTENLVLLCDNKAFFQLNDDAKNNGMTVFPADRTINGIAVDKVITPFGTFYIRLGRFLKTAAETTGTALFINPNVMSPVEQDTPGKGNFFIEDLAKTGASENKMIYGKTGLDYGPEWYHGKITGISTEFTPQNGKRVFVVNPVETIDEKPEIDAATLETTLSDGSLSLSFTTTTEPSTTPTAAIVLQNRATSSDAWATIPSEATAGMGDNEYAISYDYTTYAGDFRAVVTLSGSAKGSATSNTVTTEPYVPTLGELEVLFTPASGGDNASAEISPNVERGNIIKYKFYTDTEPEVEYGTSVRLWSVGTNLNDPTDLAAEIEFEEVPETATGVAIVYCNENYEALAYGSTTLE